MTTPKPHIAHTLLTRAHSPDTADTLFTERIKQRPLFLRPTSPTPDDNRNRRRLHRLRKKEYFLRKQKPKPLSAREKRKTGIHDLRPEECKYEVFRGLHAMWVEYMQEILDLKGQSQGQGQPPVTSLSHGSKLVSADFHGAEIEVVKSRCSGRVGLKGIVVRDTKFTFVVVTKGDEVKTIPKEQTVVRFCVPLPTPTDVDEDTVMTQDDNDKDKQPSTARKDLVFEIHGSQFQNRAVDRAHKKFKWNNIAWESLIMQSAYSNPTQSGGTHMLLVMPRYTANWGGLCEDQKQHMRKASVTMNGICASSGVNAHVYLPDEIEGVAQPMFKIFHRQVHQIFILGDYQVYVP